MRNKNITTLQYSTEMRAPRFNLNFIRPVINFVTFLSITPKCDFNTGELKHLHFTKIIAACFSVITAFFAFYFALQRLMHADSEKSKAIAYITEFRTFLITMSNVNAMMAIPFRNAGKFKLLLQYAVKFQDMCKSQGETGKIYTLIFAYNVYIIGYTVCHLIFSIQRRNFQDVQNYIFNYIQFYYFYMSSLLLFAFILFIYKCLKMYNWALKQCICNEEIYSITKSRELKDICDHLRYWCDIIKLFNAIFGWQIFITLMVIIFDLLLTLNMIIETTGAHLALLLIWSFTLLFLGMNLSHCCEKVKQELQIFYSVCYGGIYGCENEEIKKNLINLVGQMAFRDPKISAAGFLVIDHNMLFTLLNMLISYIIVLEQIEGKA